MNREHIEDNVRVDDAGCWHWIGGKTKSRSGYPRTSEGYIHRLSYEAFVGPIPEGHEVDHLCYVVTCCNPDHLEPVTPEENKRRAVARRAAFLSTRTHCRNGHLVNEKNTRIRKSDGVRICQPCNADAVKRYELRRASA